MTETVSSQIGVDAAPDAILGVLVDFDSYPEWAKQVKSVKVLKKDRKGRAQQVEFEVTPGPLPKVRYVLSYTYSPDGLSWQYVEGDLKDMHGSYRLTEQNDGTSVVYELAIDPGRIPLPGFVKARAAREITKVALQELKRRVELG
jgi:uncharacterized membrane protein